MKSEKRKMEKMLQCESSKLFRRNPVRATAVDSKWKTKCMIDS